MDDPDDAQDTTANYAVFRDCLFSALVSAAEVSCKASTTVKSRRPGARKRDTVANKSTSTASSSSSTATVDTPNDPSGLADFSAFLAGEIFPSLPTGLQALSHSLLRSDQETSDAYSLPLTLSVLEKLTDPIPPSVTDTLTTYTLISPPQSDLSSFLSPVLSSYVAATTTPPPPWVSTRTSACEICDRDWIPLTYHHLIPRAVHAKVVKRGWHAEEQLGSVAWLCRACHSFVHRMAGNEELAREWFTVERILGREDVERWRGWVGRVRWKKT